MGDAQRLALPSRNGLAEIAGRLDAADEALVDRLRGRLRIGLQWQTQVTLQGRRHTVSQAYCSALPVAYAQQPAHLWAAFAQLVLDAAYEATFCAAVLNAHNYGSDRLFLTLLGGGAFGNDTAWIIGAIRRALTLFADVDLDVAIVSYGASKREVQPLLT